MGGARALTSHAGAGVPLSSFSPSLSLTLPSAWHPGLHWWAAGSWWSLHLCNSWPSSSLHRPARDPHPPHIHGTHRRSATPTDPQHQHTNTRLHRPRSPSKGVECRLLQGGRTTSSDFENVGGGKAQV